MSRKDSRISAHTSLHVVLKGERQETRSLGMQGCVGGGMDSMLFNTDYRSKIGRQYRNFGSPDKTFRTGSNAFERVRQFGQFAERKTGPSVQFITWPEPWTEPR